MQAPPNEIPAFDLAHVLFNDCALVSQFMRESVAPIVDRHARERDPHGVVREIFGRALRWLHTMGKLNNQSDYQAVIAGVRALFEMVVDLTLLTSDRDRYPATLVLEWERSAKLKHAKAMIDYGSAHPSFEVPQPFRDFAAKATASIHARRDELWQGKHPNRWTGSRDLRQDAHAADELAGGGDLEAFYVARHSMLSWSVHGSALTGARNLSLESEQGISVQAFMEAGEFAMRCAQWTLRYLDAFDPQLFKAVALLRLQQQARLIEQLRPKEQQGGSTGG